MLQFAGQFKQVLVPSLYLPVPQLVMAAHYPDASAGAVEGQTQAPLTGEPKLAWLQAVHYPVRLAHAEQFAGQLTQKPDAI